MLGIVVRVPSFVGADTPLLGLISARMNFPQAPPAVRFHCRSKCAWSTTQVCQREASASRNRDWHKECRTGEGMDCNTGTPLPDMVVRSPTMLVWLTDIGGLQMSVQWNSDPSWQEAQGNVGSRRHAQRTDQGGPRSRDAFGGPCPRGFTAQHPVAAHTKVRPPIMRGVDPCGVCCFAGAQRRQVGKPVPRRDTEVREAVVCSCGRGRTSTPRRVTEMSRGSSEATPPVGVPPRQSAPREGCVKARQ